MSATGLRQLQDALNRKADAVQREFIAISERLRVIAADLPRVEPEKREELRAEQEALHERQGIIADEINLWRDRARAVTGQRGEDALRGYLRQLLEISDDTLRPFVERALFLLDASEEELARLAEATTTVARPSTPAGRLIERARTEFDLRGSDRAPRQKAAVEFANRTGVATDDSILAEVAAAMGDADPIVSEVVTLTAIQMHRFRAVRHADLDVAHQSVEQLAQIKHPAAVPVLAEVLKTQRTGFVEGKEGPTEGDNARSRMVALAKLIEWHTAEARAAVQRCQLDSDKHIARVASRALELFPDEWAGTLTT